MTDYLKFKKLHQQSTPLFLGNVWNVQSAQVFQTLGFQAIGTSSAAIAHTLGYQDGEQMPFNEMLFVVEKIKKNTHLPLTVDMEFGYGQTSNEIADNIERLAQLKVVGINLEDSFVAGSTRKLTSAYDFHQRMKEVIDQLQQRKISMFINIRCDVFLLGLPDSLQETATRIALYQLLDIDGIFLPCLTSIKDMEYIIKKTHLPVNVMFTPDLPDFKSLSDVGIKRISMGNSLNELVYSNMRTTVEDIVKEQSFQVSV
ncbi:MAG: isocitrate lyase/PEP mutase family protein [Sphingobacterium sp.]